MKQFNYTIQEAVGIHARPAGLLVKEVKKYKSTVTVILGDKSSNALKLMARTVLQRASVSPNKRRLPLSLRAAAFLSWQEGDHEQ